MEITTVKDVYIGKPDARDEVEFMGAEKFIQSFVMPTNFDMSGLINGDKCYISGYKGTGKTAVLYYLENEIKKQDASSCASFLFFKEDYPDLKRKKIDTISKKLISSIEIDKKITETEQDFEYIWRWLFFKKIISDNMDFNNMLFEQDSNWELFEKSVSKVFNVCNKNLSFASKIKMKLNINNEGISPEVELDLTKKDNVDEYEFFVETIDEITQLFMKLKRTDIPYYIFVDELEVYFIENEKFQRDLKIVRDLVFTVKFMNSKFNKIEGSKTKIICSIRTEIINSINKFIAPKELNKITSGFECPLNWDYNNTNSYAHPIIEILLKRISIAEKANGITFENYEQIYKKWFPTKVETIDPANYILNNSWSKPRDIVRLLRATENCLHRDSKFFSQAVFDSSFQKYSEESLSEVREELRAIYSSDEINNIFSCLNGFRVLFTKEEFIVKYNKTIRAVTPIDKLTAILQDLYRLGVIGNYSVLSKNHRYQHKGNDSIIITDEWLISVHRALQKSLSLNKKIDYNSKYIKSRDYKKDDIVEFIVKKIVPGFLLGDINENGNNQNGNNQNRNNASIHISNLSEEYVDNITQFTSVGQILQAKVLIFNSLHNKWELTLKM